MTTLSSLDGQPAPDFNLPGSDGAMHALKDYRGKTVVLYFYPKDNTPGCTKEACGFRDHHAELQAKGIVILGVSKDATASHQGFAKKHNLPFVLLSDPDTSVMSAYGAWGEKLMYGKPVMGTIRSTVIIGPDGIIQKHWPIVRNAEQHPDKVLAHLAG